MSDEGPDIDAIIARLRADPARPRPACDKCGKRPRARGVRYCGHCCQAVILHLEMVKYLKPVPDLRRRKGNGGEIQSETKRGHWQR